MQESCSSTGTTVPLVVGLVLIGIVTCGLVSLYIKERLLNKQKKLAARGMSAEGVYKNRERLESIKSKGGARLTETLDPNPNNADLEYLSRRNLSQLNEGGGNAS